MQFIIKQVPEDVEAEVQAELLDIICRYGLVLIVDSQGCNIEWTSGDEACIGVEEANKKGGEKK